MSTSTVTRQPHLSSCRENPAHGFLQPKRACFSVFLSTPESNNALFSSGDCFLHSASLQICLCPPNYFLSCLPQQGCVGLNPQLVVRPGSLTDGYPAPSPH
jgi:hypothetical protein